MNRQQQYLKAMGIQAWQLRHTDTPAQTTAEAPPVTSDAVEVVPPAETAGLPVAPDVTAMDWESLQTGVSECTRCELHASRTQTVFGVGNREADWLVIGEAPGRDEDRQGEPFVGRAGQLLNAMLRAAGLRREQVYIANILKCRPPNNRDPKPAEVGCCEPYLERQIALIQPRVILAVGRIAAWNLLKTETPIGKLRGSVHRYADIHIPVIVTYHPAYLLRSPLEKRKAWSDLQLAMATLQDQS